MAHSRDREGVGMAHKATSPKTSLNFPKWHWAVLDRWTKPKQASDRSETLSKLCYKILFNGIFYWLNYPWTSITQQWLRVYTDSIFSFVDVSSVQEVPFSILHYIQCILYGLTMCPIHLCWQQKVSIWW